MSGGLSTNITTFLDTRTDDQLRKIIDIELRGWGCGSWIGTNGQRCLVVNVFPDAGQHHDLHSPMNRWARTVRQAFGQVAASYDGMCRIYGVPVTVKRIKDYALEVLLSRNPLETRVREQTADV